MDSSIEVIKIKDEVIESVDVPIQDGIKVKKELIDSSEVEVIAFKNEDIELFDAPIQNRMKAVNEFKAKKKMMESSEIEVIKIKDEVTEFCEVQTKIKSGNEVKFKKKMMKMNEIFEFQNGIELIDQLDIPVNNEIKDDMEQGNLFRDIGNFSGAWYELSFGTVS